MVGNLLTEKRDGALAACSASAGLPDSVFFAEFINTNILIFTDHFNTFFLDAKYYCERMQEHIAMI